jgi:hypothetical protein
MTQTTPVKGYCMKCDVLIHIPSGTPFTGLPEEDKFIGSPSVLLSEKNRNGLEITLAGEGLALTWREGKESKIERIPYGSITTVDLGERRQNEVASADSITGAILGGGILVAELYLSHVKTLKVKTQQRNYEMYVPDAQKWAGKLGDLATKTHAPTIETPLSSPAITGLKQEQKFCRKCGKKIPRDSTYCEECGAQLA